MRLFLRKNKLVVRYEKEEYELLEKKFKELGMERRRTSNLWGLGIAAEFYRINDAYEDDFHRTFSGIGNYFTDINAPFYKGDRVNLCFLRVVPNEQMEVEIPLEKFLTIRELNYIVEKVKRAYSLIFNLTGEAEVEIKIKKEKKEE